MKSLSNCACKIFLCFVIYPFHFVVPEMRHQQLFPGFGHFPLSTREDSVHVFIIYIRFFVLYWKYVLFLKIERITLMHCMWKWKLAHTFL